MNRVMGRRVANLEDADGAPLSPRVRAWLGDDVPADELAADCEPVDMEGLSPEVQEWLSA